MRFLYAKCRTVCIPKTRKLFQLQFQPLDLDVKFFGFPSKLIAPPLGDPQLDMLDLGSARVQLGFQPCDLVVAFLDATFAHQ